MSKPRRTGAETSETRARLLDVTEQIMLAEGYAAVSSRSIAKEAGVTPALVHYYFPTLDDLFLEVLRRRAEQQLARQDRMLSSDRPLHALWKQSKDPDGAGLLTELMALANHRKVVRVELAEYAEKFRLVQLEALEDHINERGLDVPPVTLLVLVAGMARALVLEESLGMNTGIADTYAAIERLLDTIEPPPTTQ
jgi:AcrR family transcriptional regulator